MYWYTLSGRCPLFTPQDAGWRYVNPPPNSSLHRCVSLSRAYLGLSTPLSISAGGNPSHFTLWQDDFISTRKWEMKGQRRERERGRTGEKGKAHICLTEGLEDNLGLVLHLHSWTNWKFRKTHKWASQLSHLHTHTHKHKFRKTHVWMITYVSQTLS